MINTAIAGGVGIVLGLLGTIGGVQAANSAGDGVPQSNLYIYAD